MDRWPWSSILVPLSKHPIIYPIPWTGMEGRETVCLSIGLFCFVCFVCALEWPTTYIGTLPHLMNTLPILPHTILTHGSFHVITAFNTTYRLQALVINLFIVHVNEIWREGE
ncbi:hypothetical protein BGZ63DRAFT_376155 [Mariannaea sp. PMI_226]|nr:hypothetical protein BGZ63DRAFT_376155 [Mariannaea sp. PMI_226]